MDVCINPVFERDIVINDSTGTAIQVSGTSIYGLRANDWNITGPTTDGGDCGVFYITGNGQLTNIYRNQGMGYLMRDFLVVLGGLTIDQNVLVQNCIDAYTNHYGTLDIQMHTDLLRSTAAIPLTGTNTFFLNNTSAHKKHDASYVSNALIQGDMVDDMGKIWTSHLKNSIAYDATVSGMANGSSLFKPNYQKAIIDSSNNIDIPPGQPLPVGLIVDQVNFQPVPGGYLDQHGIGAQILIPVCPIIHDTITVTIHDTLPRVCPVCPVCPAPIVCPPIPKQRTAIGIVWDIILNKKVISYDDGTQSNL